MFEPPGHKVLLGYGVNMERRTKRVPVYMYDEHRKRGTFVFGTTGVGKTRLEELLVTDDIRSGKSVIVFDPKADQRLFSKIYEIAEECGREREMQLITSIYPEHSVGIDPMAYYYDPEELIQHAISGIQGNDPFFGAASKLFVTPIVYGNLILAKSEGRLPTVSLHEIYDGLTKVNQESLKSSLQKIPQPMYDEEDVKFYVSMLESNLAKPDDYREKICTTLQSSLVPLIAGHIGKIIGKAESNKLIKRIEDGDRVITVVHTGTMVSPSSAAILGRVLLSMIMATIGRHYVDVREKMEPALSLHIDEAHSIINKDTLNILAMAGSANVMTHLYSQALSQIHAALGNKDLGISAMSNTNTKIFFKSPDPDTAEYVVRHFGVHDVLSGVFGNGQITTRTVEKNVLNETDLLHLQPQEVYMMSYTGGWAFVTDKVPDPSIKIIFPGAQTAASNQAPSAP